MGDRRLHLAFKGNRDYVHGTTMFDEAARCLSDVGHTQLTDVEFLIHKMANTHLRLHVGPQQAGAPTADDIAVMRFVAQGQPMQARLKSDAGVPELRVPYDESQITHRCEVDAAARCIRLARDVPGFSQIEVLVSMCKALHLAVLDKPQGTNWVFCRWESPEWPLRAGLHGVSMALKQTLGTRLTRTEVESNGHPIGQIYFSAKTAP